MTTRRTLRGLAALALLPGAVWATPVTVTVSDAAGVALGNAVVSLVPEGGRRAGAAPAAAVIEQRNRQFAPQVTVVQVGAAVSFPNHDTVRHHVYSFSPARTFEIKLYAGTPAAPVVFDQPGTAVLGCNIHDQMVAWVHVVDTPWFAKSSAGEARLPDVPPGAYRLRVWHPSMPPEQPPHDEAVTVAAAPVRITVRLALSARP